ncbi:MAG: hypothetical protein LBT19_00405 [Candidatus Nomurabacteria bacterium]|jgi:hypothetical protein|nr:hypothetical protein [Candidatus Nomurabacteria bacterium]
MDVSLLIFLVAILVVGVLVFIAIAATKKRGPAFDRENYQVDFLKIENNLTREDENSYSMAIVNADKLLDKALCEMGIPGRTMGDRLKKVGKDKFSQLNSVWYAHKLRNQIAHEHDFRPDYDQAKHALSTYRQALRDLGAI